MDQKKSLIMLLSIVVVVIVVILVCIWALVPRTTTAAGTNTASSLQYVQGSGGTPASTPAVGAAGQNPGGNTVDTSGAQVPSPAPLTPGSGNSNYQTQTQKVDIFYGTSPGAVQPGADGKLVVQGSPSTTLSPGVSPSPTSAAQGQYTGIPAAGTSSPGPSSAPGTKNGDAGKKSPQNANAGQRRPAPVPVNSVSGNGFWIQVIASPSRDRVEQVRKDLSAMGFNGRVTTKPMNGVDYYRLRYGPYTKRAEADKFLAWVQVIKGLDKSFLTEEKLGTSQANNKSTEPAVKNRPIDPAKIEPKPKNNGPMR